MGRRSRAPSANFSELSLNRHYQSRRVSVSSAVDLTGCRLSWAVAIMEDLVVHQNMLCTFSQVKLTRFIN